jgi:glutamate-ammonia-ligase adenylyltransferase
MFLRRVEHRVQMVADRQTHALPETPAGLEALAVFLGYGSAGAFADEALGHLERVHGVFSGLFRAAPMPPDVARGAEPVAANPGPQDSEPVWNAWMDGRPRALRTERSRALLEEVLPDLLAAMARQADPQGALRRLDEFIWRLPAGVQFFSLLHHNPALLERLGDVLGAAPWLADHLAAVPSALEGLVNPQDGEADPAAALAASLRDSRGLDDSLAIASRFVRAEEFRLAVAEFSERMDADSAGLARTGVADAAISALLPQVLDDHAARYGRIRGGGMVVVALGKAGSREMMCGSDLDLMLIYDHPQDVAESKGGRALPASQYFARAAQAVIAALTVPPRDGPLYAVDMRLRPSGNTGPVAVSLRSFEKYHRTSAWTWERLALTRARVVAGPGRLRGRVERAIRAALLQGDATKVRADTVAMRRRLLKDLPPKGAWDVKLRPGGLIEVEFVVQALLLLAADGKLLDPVTSGAVANLARAGIVDAADAALLTEADFVWRSVQGLLRVALGRSIPTSLSGPLLEKVAHAAGVAAEERALVARLDRLAASVRAAFVRHVGEIGIS